MEQTPLIRYLSLVELLCFAITAFLYKNSIITLQVFIVIILSISFLVGGTIWSRIVIFKRNKKQNNYKL